MSVATFRKYLGQMLNIILKFLDNFENEEGMFYIFFKNI